MKSLQKHILVFGQPTDHDLSVLESLLEELRCSVAFAQSQDQIVAQTYQSPPCLIILSGNGQNWSSTFIRYLRSFAHAYSITIVALTDCHAPSWLHREEHPGLDGFLVKPISVEVLSSLVHSAWVRQACLTPA